MVTRQRIAASFAVASAVVALCAGCASDAWAAPHPEPTAVGALGKGFEPSSSPSPEATITPSPGSWNDLHPSAGYRVVLLIAGTDKATRTLEAAVRKWAEEERVDLRAVSTDGDHIAGIVSAIEMRPDLIVSVGNDLVDPLAVVTANHLDQQFLVVGAEVAEPTHNVTAVDWTGASFRGEGLGTPSSYNAESFTAKRCAAAVRAGVAAVLHKLTGIVLWIE
ncbi:MAG TPA: hypothetical protein VNT53_08305 [Pseudolysinimonas sp.]|nr:hypothetical protein [Pseudolysinimonas sp.]